LRIDDVISSKGMGPAGGGMGDMDFDM